LFAKTASTSRPAAAWFAPRFAQGLHRYGDRPKFEDVEVGAVVIATGFDSFDPTTMKQYGYGKLPNVISAESSKL